MFISTERTGSVPVLVVFAPTASGKTELALRMFGKNSVSPMSGLVEVLSADSMQVYQGLNIGTAKPTADELLELPHHLIDINTPDQPFSTGDFVRMADDLCQDIYGRGKLPVVLGGTGFYIRNFLCGLPSTPESDESLRLELKRRLEHEGGASLYAELCRLDPVSAKAIHPNDYYRILRALEVCFSSGRPRSSFVVEDRLRDGYDFCTVILERNRAELYDRINRRVENMFEAGLAEEVASLVAMGYTADSPGMQAIGYREFFSEKVLAATSEEERISLAKELICRDSRRYAKRQYTFVRGIPDAKSFPADVFHDIEKFVMCFMERHGW